MPDRDLLLEIGTEEIPAGFLPPAARQIESDARRILAEKRIAAAALRTFATPCRLVLHVKGIAAAAETRVIERTGPPWESAFGADGKPTAALAGFLRSAGATEKSVVKIPKKDREFVGVRIMEKGRPTAKILAEVLPGMISGIHFPKNMRWRSADPAGVGDAGTWGAADSGGRGADPADVGGSDAATFARPVRSILCILHGRPVSFSLFGLKSGAKTTGNKFFFPKPFRPAGADDYFRRMEKTLVMVDPARRRCKILRESEKILAGKRMKSEMPEELLTEVVHLTEYPTVLIGDFDPSFLDIPDVILKSTMSHHQRYFPVTTTFGALAPHFLIVRNGPPDKKKLVAKGNARVLKARFSDAKYFYENDRKKTLAERIDGLKGVVYLEGLGSLHDRARRVRDLMVILPPRIGVEIDLERYGDLAYLCKADLLTEVVREFPELQGVMGTIYAKAEGRPAEISQAIAEHYQPRGPQDPLPDSPLGALLALADKFELLFGAFSIGFRPTASADPYGLRRAAIGISRILLARAWHLGVDRLIDDAAQIFPDPDGLKKSSAEILDFFRGRLDAQLREKYPAELVAACIGVSDDPCEIAGKVEAFSKVSAEGKERWLALIRTAKRAYNIVKSEKNIVPLNAAGFVQEEERALFQAFKDWQTHVRGMPERKYSDRLRAISQMAPHLQRFFEKVFVMVDDAHLRNNRLALIKTISDAFRSYAQFDKIAVGD